MAVDPKLEAYLTSLDRALSQVSVSDRADILMEIKSHVLDSMEKHPTQNISAVLSSLGEPETVANRYLMERGLKPGKAPRTPIIKWLTIGFLGTFSLFLLFILIVIWKFSPLISVDDKNEKVEILGGLISIDGADGGDFNFKDSPAGKIDGEETLDPATTDLIEIRFSSGKFDINTSEDVGDKTLNWNCKGVSLNGKSVTSLFNQDATTKTAVLNLDQIGIAKCDLSLPKGFKSKITGINGKIALNKPQADLALKVDNGKVDFEGDEALAYSFDIKTVNGSVDNFKSSDKADAIKIAIELTNGRVSNSSTTE